jgi:hypothetical protein
MRRFDEGTIAAIGAPDSHQDRAHYKWQPTMRLLIKDRQSHAGLNQKFKLSNLF